MVEYSDQNNASIFFTIKSMNTAASVGCDDIAAKAFQWNRVYAAIARVGKLFWVWGNPFRIEAQGWESPRGDPAKSVAESRRQASSRKAV